MSNDGVVFDIQRFSINDGDGIRTTVFFKGCSLRCRWCHNPESIATYTQLKHDAKKCILCGKCVKHVKNNGIEIEKKSLKIDFIKHDTNFELLNVCPNHAYGVFGNKYSASEVVEIVLKDFDYYKNSGGGVTFSGGEAINQIDFLVILGSILKKHGIHICLDVSGYGNLIQYEKSLIFTDTYLLDYKLTDKNLCKKYIGQEINIEEKLIFLEKNNKQVFLRCIIIPEINDNEEHFKAIADLSNKYKCIAKVDILPYHNMVKAEKFNFLNYYEKYRIPDKDNFEIWKFILKKYSLKNGFLENKSI